MAGFEDRDAWGPGASRRAPCACRRGAKTEGSVTTTRRWGGKAVNRCRWPYFAIGSKRSMARRLPPGSPALFLPLPWSTREAHSQTRLWSSARAPLSACRSRQFCAAQRWSHRTLRPTVRLERISLCRPAHTCTTRTSLWLQWATGIHSLQLWPGFERAYLVHLECGGHARRLSGGHSLSEQQAVWDDRQWSRSK